MRFWIDIEDSAGTKQGAGPIITALDWEDTRRLDRAGRFSSSMPGGDPRSDIVQKKYVARCSTLLQNSGTVSEIGAGLIDRIERTPHSDGRIDLRFSGDDLLRELTNTHVGTLSIDDGAGGADVTGPDDIITLAAAGWSLDTDAGFESTSTSILHQYASETVLQALTKLAEMTGEHFRLGTGRKVVWMRRAGSAKVTHGGITGTFNASEAVTGQTSGATGTVVEATASYLYIEDVDGSFVDGEDIEGDVTGATVTVTTAYNPSSRVRALQAANVISMEDNAQICIIRSLTEMEDSFDALVGRIYAMGSGNGDAILTLDGVSVAPPAGYTLSSAAGKGYYLQHDATWASYGIERVVQFKDVANVDSLYHLAYEYLRKYQGSGLTAYNLEVTKLDSPVEVGQTIRVQYRRSLEQLDGTNHWGLDVDADLYVLEKSTRIDADGVRSYQFVVADVDAWPDGDIGTLMTTMATAQALGAHAQPVDATDITGDVTVNSAHIGGTSNYVMIDSGGELTLVGTATRWDDERVPTSSARVPSAGVSPPGFAKFKDNGAGSAGVYIDWFDPDAEECLFFELQLPHSYKEGSTIYPHAHWVPNANGGAGETVEWGLEYTVADIGDTFGNTSIEYGKVHYPADASLVASKHYMTHIPTGGVSGSGLTISAMYVCRVFRNATDAADDTYTDDAGLLGIDFHYELDTMGSKTETSK